MARHKCYILLTLLAVLTTVVGGCSPSAEVPAEFITIENAEWPYTRPLLFNEKGDTLGSDIAAVELTLRHTKAYEYANLWLQISYLWNDSVVSDTFNVLLADDYGKWYGKNVGPVVTLTDTLMLGHVPDTASCFELRHIMRVDKVNDIEQIGLRYFTRGPQNATDAE